MPVERFLVDPATTREGWEIEYNAAKSSEFKAELRSLVYEHDQAGAVRVLVFDAPKETT